MNPGGRSRGGGNRFERPSALTPRGLGPLNGPRFDGVSLGRCAGDASTSAMEVGLRASLRSAASEPVVAAVAKKRAVRAREWVGSSRRIRAPHTPDGAAAFDTSPDLLEVHAEIRVRIPEPRVPLNCLRVFPLNGHTPVIGFAPQKVARATRQPPWRFLSPSVAK